MALTLTPANVQGGVVTAIALAAPGASFSGIELGMKTNGMLEIEPALITMSSDNDYTDAWLAKITADTLQNTIADFGAAYTYATTGAQAIVKTSSDDVGLFVGADWSVATVLGCMVEWKFSQEESVIQYILQSEIGDTELAAAWGVSAGAHTWTAGYDIAKRKRRGVQSITIGGAPVGLISSCTGSIKTRNKMVQIQRPIAKGLEANVKFVMEQTAQADFDALRAVVNEDDTVIVTFWNGQSIKFTGLFAGKAAKMTFSKEHGFEVTIKGYWPKGTTRIDYTTDADVLELIMLDNVAS